jgi:hypothetical protein
MLKPGARGFAARFRAPFVPTALVVPAAEGWAELPCDCGSCIRCTILRADAACYLAESNPALRMPGEKLEPIYLRKPQAERERAARRGETA